MKKFFKLFTIVGILAAGGLIAFGLWKTKPKAVKKETKVSLPIVEVLPVNLETHEVIIPSQGIVESARRSVIASEIAGKVDSVSDKFDSGRIFAKDEIFLQLDSSDYLAAIAQSKASLADAHAALAAEKAKSEQAKRDWKRLGNGGEPGDLTLRGPQLRSAQARVDAAVAAIEMTEMNLSRTSIRAPFPAVISKTRTEIGSYLVPGAAVVEVFQTSPYEIRLPLSIDEMQFLKLNEKGEPVGEVEISTTAAGLTTFWKAKIIRTEREVDRSSRSIYVVAEVSTLQNGDGIVLQPGLFIEAKIKGRSFDDIAKVPFSAFLDLKRVVVVDPDNKLRFREVALLRREGKKVFVSSGLGEGERLCLTELPGMIEGASVTPILWKTDSVMEVPKKAPPGQPKP